MKMWGHGVIFKTIFYIGGNPLISDKGTHGTLYPLTTMAKLPAISIDSRFFFI